ncbi:hypothetical protein [Streptomyces sp. NPDC002573]
MVVVLGTAEDLAKHFKPSTLQPLIGGTTRSGQTSYALLQQMGHVAG